METTPMTKIAYIGAGSTAMSRKLIADILSYPELRDTTLCLMDLDAHWLDLSRRLAEKLVADNGLSGPKIETTTERQDALDSADYVITTLRVGGLKALICGAEIALDHGLNICMDGGALQVSKALYNVPVLLDICHQMEALCPEALLINYTEPLSVAQAAIEGNTRIRTIGISDGVPDTIGQIARWLGVSYDEIEHTVAGTSEMGWILGLAQAGQDLYPRLCQEAEGADTFWSDQVRFTVMKYFGAFPTPNKWTVSDWMPYFRLREEDIIGMNVPPMVGPAGVTRAYRHRPRDYAALLEGGKVALERSRDYGAPLIRALQTGESFRFHGIVSNEGYVANLNRGACVEVPCLVQEGRIVPQEVGALPTQLAAWDIRIQNVETLMLKAALERDREAVYQAVQLQPLTSAAMPIPEMRRMVDETLAAQAQYVPAEVAW